MKNYFLLPYHDGLGMLVRGKDKSLAEYERFSCNGPPKTISL